MVMTKKILKRRSSERSGDLFEPWIDFGKRSSHRRTSNGKDITAMAMSTPFQLKTISMPRSYSHAPTELRRPKIFSRINPVDNRRHDQRQQNNCFQSALERPFLAREKPG
jgi:hypothetical protein